MYFTPGYLTMEIILVLMVQGISKSLPIVALKLYFLNHFHLQKDKIALDLFRLQGISK